MVWKPESFPTSEPRPSVRTSLTPTLVPTSNTQASWAKRRSPIVPSSSEPTKSPCPRPAASTPDTRVTQSTINKRVISIGSGSSEDDQPIIKRSRRSRKQRCTSSSSAEAYVVSGDPKGKGKALGVLVSSKRIDLEQFDESNTFLDEQESILRNLTEEER